MLKKQPKKYFLKRENTMPVSILLCLQELEGEKQILPSLTTEQSGQTEK